MATVGCVDEAEELELIVVDGVVTGGRWRICSSVAAFMVKREAWDPLLTLHVYCHLLADLRRPGSLSSVGAGWCCVKG